MPRELPPTGSIEPRCADLFRAPGISFEAALADWLGVPEVQVECSGTVCLFIALEYLKRVSPARQVVLLGYTCPLVALAVQRAGLEIRVCDTAREALDFDFGRLPELLGEQTLCVVATHWGGALADAARLCEVVRAHAPQARVVEDCAQAFGATMDGGTVGLTGHLGFFSFAAGKGLSLYEGGCLLSRDAGVRRGLRETAARLIARRPGWEAWRALQLLAYHAFYRPRGLYFAYGRPRRYWLARGDLVRALDDDRIAMPMHRVGAWRQRVGACALGRYREHLERIRATHRRIERRLAGIGGVRLYASPPGARPSCTYVLFSVDSAERAARLLQTAATAGLGVSRLFACALDAYPGLAGIVPACELPNARRMAACSLTLSTTSYLTAADEAAVLELVAQAAPSPA
jgi:dTDP-4-amino-4,6-dideoxygalactose transaminase